MGRSKNPAQLSFAFDNTQPPGPPSTERHALFFAILPDDDCAKRAHLLAADLYREHALAGKPRPHRLLHMSLCGVGVVSRLPEDAIEQALRVGSSVDGAPFSMSLDEVWSFKQPKHPIVLCASDDNSPFQMLHVRLALALRNCGIMTPVTKKLRPHMTLAYKGKEIAKSRPAAPISLKAREFVLVRSYHGESRHEYLGRWPLTQTSNTFG